MRPGHGRAAAGRVAADDSALLLVRTRELDPRQVAAWELPAEPTAVGRAQELATGQLRQWGLEELSYTTELVVSELVTNAVRHAAGPLHLRLLRDLTLLTEVSDTGHTSPTSGTRPATTRAGGGCSSWRSWCSAGVPATRRTARRSGRTRRFRRTIPGPRGRSADRPATRRARPATAHGVRVFGPGPMMEPSEVPATRRARTKEDL